VKKLDGNGAHDPIALGLEHMYPAGHLLDDLAIALRLFGLLEPNSAMLKEALSDVCLKKMELDCSWTVGQGPNPDGQRRVAKACRFALGAIALCVMKDPRMMEEFMSMSVAMEEQWRGE